MPRASARFIAGLIALIVAVFAIFAVWPGIDLWVSNQFYLTGRGFLINDQPWIEAGRMAVWDASIMLFVVALLALPVALWRGAWLGLPGRAWGGILLLYVLGPGLLVDILLKRHWGRARPVDVAEFGGALRFTPANEISNQCFRDCSFVSGEVSGASVLAICLLLILWFWRSKLSGMAYVFAQITVLAVPVLISVQRIASGRHFLSDAILAALFMVLLAAGVSRLLPVSPPCAKLR